MIITPERFNTLIETYGTQAQRWPEDEREIAIAYLRTTPSARLIVEEYQELDDLLDLHCIPSLTLIEKRVLSNSLNLVRETLIDRLLNWLLPHSERVLAWIWRPALVAAFPLVFGIFLSNYYSFGIEQSSHSLEEELYMLSLNDYAEIQQW